MKKHSLVIGIIAGLIAAPTASHAKWTRNAPATCTIKSSTHDFYMEDNGATTTNGATFYCPIYDASDFAKTEITKVNAHFYDGSTSNAAYARACVTRWDSTGGTCDATHQTYGTGVKTLSMTGNGVDVLNATANAYDFGFIHIGIGSGITFLGYFTQD